MRRSGGAIKKDMKAPFFGSKLRGLRSRRLHKKSGFVAVVNAVYQELTLALLIA